MLYYFGTMRAIEICWVDDDCAVVPAVFASEKDALAFKRSHNRHADIKAGFEPPITTEPNSFASLEDFKRMTPIGFYLMKREGRKWKPKHYKTFEGA